MQVTESSSKVDTPELPVTLTPCLGEWLANQDFYVTLSDMYPIGGCHVLQLINISLEGETPTGEVMLHDGVHYITCKVCITMFMLGKGAKNRKK